MIENTTAVVNAAVYNPTYFTTIYLHLRKQFTSASYMEAIPICFRPNYNSSNTLLLIGNCQIATKGSDSEALLGLCKLEDRGALMMWCSDQMSSTFGVPFYLKGVDAFY